MIPKKLERWLSGTSWILCTICSKNPFASWVKFAHLNIFPALLKFVGPLYPENLKIKDYGLICFASKINLTPIIYKTFFSVSNFSILHPSSHHFLLRYFCLLTFLLRLTWFGHDEVWNIDFFHLSTMTLNFFEIRWTACVKISALYWPRQLSTRSTAYSKHLSDTCASLQLIWWTQN